jgi:hypothetical protein
MQIKKFLVQFEFADDTRWPNTDSAVADNLAQCAHAVARVNSLGPLPQVTVTPEEQRPIVTHSKLP